MKRYAVRFTHLPYGTHACLTHTIKRFHTRRAAELECDRLAMKNGRIVRHSEMPCRDGYSVTDCKRDVEVYYNNGYVYYADGQGGGYYWDLTG